MSFFKNIGKNIGKSLSKNLTNKLSQKLLDHAKQSAIDTLKTAKATGDMIGNKVNDVVANL